ncbi:MAG TPA: tryptophanase [Candidatus Obscuribacter sp.]|nr:tryptophanase [Candidatus Obscuribacter sp.]
MKTIIEPFRTKVVEAIKFTTRAEREEILKKAGYNLFQIKAEDVMVDFLTDSGTSAMSSEQWAALMRGDESYAGCSSYFRFEQTVQEIFGFPIVIPVHQGRAAERLLFGELVKPGHVVPSNTHFDTTRANIEFLGGEAIDLPCQEAKDSFSQFPFKGNMDIEALRALLDARGESVPFIMVTVTNNAVGGQPVSVENVREISQLARQFGKPFFIDAARFSENAYLVKHREPAYGDKSIGYIAREMFSLADGCMMSAKKDGLANMGGFIALKNEELANSVRNRLIITEGFSTYGGLNGRDLETIAVGLREAMDEDYLCYRQAAARYLANGLSEAGIPVVVPSGMHAVYIDAKKMLPNIEPSYLPGQRLVCELYIECGLRSCEIGTAMFGRTRADGSQEPARQELVRLALPRRVYGQSHYDYVIEACQLVQERSQSLTGMTIVSEPPLLRHFTAKFAPLNATGESERNPQRVESACR